MVLGDTMVLSRHRVTILEYVSVPLTSRYFFTARRYASAVCAMTLCLSVCRPSVYPSETGIVPKSLNVRSRKQRRTIAQKR